MSSLSLVLPRIGQHFMSLYKKRRVNLEILLTNGINILKLIYYVEHSEGKKVNVDLYVPTISTFEQNQYGLTLAIPTLLLFDRELVVRCKISEK